MGLKVGIVGLSGIGNNHANCYDQNELADLVAVCDMVKEKADATAERLGVKAYYDQREMLENEEKLQKENKNLLSNGVVIHLICLNEL